MTPKSSSIPAVVQNPDGRVNGLRQNGNGFDYRRVLATIKPFALFMGDMTVAGVLQLGSAAGTTTIIGIVNRMMTAYGAWFTGAVSLAWWIVAIKSLHLLFTRRRISRRTNSTTTA